MSFLEIVKELLYKNELVWKNTSIHFFLLGIIVWYNFHGEYLRRALVCFRTLKTCDLILFIWEFSEFYFKKIWLHTCTHFPCSVCTSGESWSSRCTNLLFHRKFLIHNYSCQILIEDCWYFHHSWCLLSSKFFLTWWSHEQADFSCRRFRTLVIFWKKRTVP